MLMDPGAEVSVVRPIEWERLGCLAEELDRALGDILPSDSEGPTRERASRTRATSAICAALALRRRTDGTGDLLAPASRSRGAVLAMGVEPEEYLRQALGRSRSPDGGRGPQFHWSDLERGILGPIRPPGTSLEVMAGATLSFRMRKQDRVGLVLADGSECATGAWHEGLNFAAVRRCPLVVVVDAPAPPRGPEPDASEDPRQGIRPTRLTSWLDLCDGYGIRGRSAPIDDLSALHETVAESLERARAGGGVQLVEIRGSRRPGSDEGLPEPRAESRSDDEGPSALFPAMAEEIGEQVDRALRSVLDDREPEGREALHPILSDRDATVPWYRDPAGRMGSRRAPTSANAASTSETR
ncbi:MAG: hypothetical protein EA351_13255 [Gemmatimonadales bacterium]|nr:MAG: hypothetical protein EA351_13255 [Gemmatimonadales bacterium]